MAERVDSRLYDMASPGGEVGPVVLERRSADGGWAPVWEYERTEEAIRAVQTRVGAHDGSADDYRVRPLEHPSRIKRAVLTACIAMVLTGAAILVLTVLR